MNNGRFTMANTAMSRLDYSSFNRRLVNRVPVVLNTQPRTITQYNTAIGTDAIQFIRIAIGIYR